MKNSVIKLTALALAAIMLCMSFAACADEKPNDESDSAEESKAESETEEKIKNSPAQLDIVKNNASDYVIVRSWYAQPYEIEMALLFQDTVKKLTGVTIPIEEDYENKAQGFVRAEKEIVIGTSNREDEYDPEYQRIGDGYRVFVSYEKLVLTSKSSTGLHLALKAFFEELYSADIESSDITKLDNTDMSIDSGFKLEKIFKSKEIPFMNAEFKDYTVAFTKNDYMQKRMALLIQNAVYVATGTTLKLNETNSPAATSIVLKEDSSLTNGKWQIEVNGKTIRISANDYYGFDAAALYMKNSAKHGYFDWEDGFRASGDHTQSLSYETASTAYAFRRLGDIRVMFNNVLWQNHSGLHNYDDIPCDERNVLQAEMISIYMPDVLATQETCKQKRSTTATTNPKDLGNLLKALGYEETLNPVVDNSEHTNITPLFYNTATTRLIASEYHNYTMQDPNAFPNDKSSKSMTWGVFEDIASGKGYIVISTHLCTANVDIRRQQIVEAQGIVDELIATYDLPVFYGGDFNTDVNRGNEKELYDMFPADGYTDARGAAEISTDMKTTHGYPKLDQGLNMMRPSWEDGFLIDYIMMKNADNVDLKLFGIVADECSKSASDHLPLFIDMNLN